MNMTHENNETRSLESPPPLDEPASRLDILSSVAKLDFLKEITSLDDLSENEGMVIEVLNHYSKLSGDTPATACAARHLIISCRQSLTSSKASKSDQNNSGSFDRLVYLLDRYLEFCQARNLSAWPIDHLKVGIWIKNDVIATSNSTRMKPLKKTVRCYVTSLESIRIKTLHLFKGIHLPVHLMKSNIIMQILNSLSSERDNLEERLGGNQSLMSQAESVSGSASERDVLLKQIRSVSGDHHAAEAMKIVKDSRSGESIESSGHKPARGSPNRKVKAKPDPHIHTLKRFRNFCFLNKIPMWPIDAPRVALWLRESVLAYDPRSKNKKSGVSFRTIQVYLSRLEYSRQKTEHLFPSFPNYGVSLYKSEEIADILSSQKNKHPDLVALNEACNNTYEDFEMPATLTALDDSHDHGIKAVLNPHSGSQFLEEAGTDGFSRKRKTPTDCDEYYMPSQKERRMDPQISRRDVQQRHALRDLNDRRTPSINSDTDTGRTRSRRFHQRPAPLSPSTPSSTRFSFPPISEWFSPTSLVPAKKTKGCISFILCSDEESERSFYSQSSPELLTPAGSPSKVENSREKMTTSPTRYLESPTTKRFFSAPKISDAHPSIASQYYDHNPVIGRSF